VIDQDFSGRTALVTGGADGMGWAAVQRFAARGASVALCDIDADLGAQRIAALQSQGAQASFFAVDVGDPDQCEAMVRAVVAKFGQLDFAFNNAGYPGELVPLAEQQRATWDRVIAVTLSGVFHCMRAQITVMLEQGRGGAIVNNASIAGMVGFATAAPYSAAKHGVIGLTQCAALEYGLQGIRVNAVCPGYMDTAMTHRATTAPAREAMAASTPMGRLGLPGEVADVAVWLCSNAASYINGACIPVDAGLTAA
jgi:NAD(P)-dependent dehydrogenase (short-subunit alcohol dehydrogenase family)